MPYLKIGDWDIQANGRRGTLRIRHIDEIGRVSGNVFDHRLSGWWNERGRRLTFVLDSDGADSSDDQAFQGYAWDQPAAGLGLERSYLLAGSYDTFGGGGGAKDRQAFGWFATLARPGSMHVIEAP